jgi:long-subunit acyl-CoA synthetase (AMP-forming)
MNLLDDSNTALILSRKNDMNSVQLPEEKVVFIDLEDRFFTVAGRKYVANCSSSDLAYVIYTSGTTGNPR